jgi:hypothetical protein
VAYNHTQETPRFDVLRIEQSGRGPEAKLVTSTIKSLSCGDVDDMLGDYAISTTGPYFFAPDRDVKILNWRTSSSTRHAKSTLNFESVAVRFDFFGTSFAKVLLKVIRLLPENKILAIENHNEIAIYRIPEFRWTMPLEVSPADGHLQQPLWTAWLTPQAQNHSPVTLSKLSYGPLATRLALIQGDQVYGLVIPHDGGTPALHVLAMAPALSDLMYDSQVTICIDKIYCEPESGLEASMVAFSWPEKAGSLELPTTWVPPILHFMPKQFAGHHTSVMRGNDLVDDISGRVVTGSKYEKYEFPTEVDGVKWSDIICWSVVDSFHPQFLPSSFKS